MPPDIEDEDESISSSPAGAKDEGNNVIGRNKGAKAKKRNADNGQDSAGSVLLLPHSHPHLQHEGGLLGDAPSILLLFLLYTLQGIPMGLSGSIPLMLHDKVSFSQQALFSLVSLPFSVKLLWAPLVDSIYSTEFGRRKSWLVPVQLVCGIMMVAGASRVNAWVGSDGGPPCMVALTVYFTLLYLMMATQDIAVDGWALSMLSRENVGYASTCNSIGQTVGYFVAHVGFLALQDADVCNKYLRAEPQSMGMVTLASFMFFWGIIFIGTTLFVWAFKKEEHDESEEEVGGLLQTYQQLLECVRLPSVKSLSLVLLTSKAAFAVTDAATTLKLVEYGMPKEELAMLSPLLVLFGCLVPVVVGRMTAGKRPLDVFLVGYPLRMLTSLVYVPVLIIAYRAYRQETDEGFSYFYWSLIGATALHQISSNFQYVSMMAFFAKISDPAIGGTYMTLLNTIANLGSKWCTSLSLYLIDYLSVKSCVEPSSSVGELDDYAAVMSCHDMAAEQACKSLGGSCVTTVDGYFVQVAGCSAVGIFWLWWFWRPLLDLQSLPLTSWHIAPGRSTAKFD